MEIHHYREISQSMWDEMVDSSDDCWLFHLHSWIEETAKVFSLENHYFIANEDNKSIGGFALQKREDFLYSTLMGNTGPFAIDGISSKKRTQIFSQLTEEVINWAKDNKIEAIYSSMPALAINNLNNTRGVNPLVLSDWTDTSTHTKIIDLTKTEEELWHDLSKSSRRHINAIKSAGYTVEKVDFQEMLDDYYSVHTETYMRTGVPAHPKSYFQVMADMSSSGKVILNVCRDPQGEAVAFLNSARYKNGVCVWTGCSRTGHIEAGVNYLLLWTDVLDVKKMGYQWYEITEVFPGVKFGKLKGLTNFKSRFGGDLYRFYKGKIEISRPSLIKGLMRKAKRWIYCFYMVDLAKATLYLESFYLKILKTIKSEEKYET